jgi:hypothetical protein
VLAYLDALITALTVRDTTEAERLLRHPLARILPDEARDEAVALSGGTGDPLAVPLRVMRLRHQTAELLFEAPIVADREEEPDAPTGGTRGSRPRSPARARRAGRMVQMELPLSA